MDAAELQAEREALIAEIYAAFKDVSREGGVSWSETQVLDDERELASEKTARERSDARARDTDRHWADLLESADWLEVPGRGSFSFLDPIGFRYYLPAAMVHDIRGVNDDRLMYYLDLAQYRGLDAVEGTRGASPQDEARILYTMSTISLLDNRQRRCAARFLRYKIASTADEMCSIEQDSWRDAYESYWQTFE